MQIEVRPLREARPSPVRPESVGCTFIWDIWGPLGLGNSVKTYALFNEILMKLL